jgi:hypothetical protein
MAIVRAVKTGVWSDVTVWNTGALPTSADDVYSNTFTVTINVSPTVLSISNATATGVTAGGSFVPNNGITLTATGNGVVAGSTATSCLQVSLTTGQSCSVVAKVTGGTVSGAHGIYYLANNGTLNITGDCTYGLFATAYSLRLDSNATVNINGINHSGIYNYSTAGIVNITGNTSGSSNNNGWGVLNNSTGTILITGNCTAGSGSPAQGVINNGSGSATISGTITASNQNNGFTSTSLSATAVLSGPFIAASNGNHAVLCGNWRWPNSSVSPTYYQIRTLNLATIRPLYTADSVGGNPAITNVRSGTVFGPDGELTGTLAVPPTGSVALGVPVDNTTGTAIITEAAIANALTAASAVTLNQQTSSLTTSGSIGERLKLASTVATTAQQLSDALSNE